MSLESILERIVNEATGERERIILEARGEAKKILQEARQEADTLYQAILLRSEADYASQKKRQIINARLGHKKNLLEAKQEIVDSVFKKLRLAFKAGAFKKQLVSADKVSEVAVDIDFYLGEFRQDYETEIAQVLFK